MPIEESAGAVVFYRRGKKIEYLLLHHELGHWDFPKGWIEKGEKLEDTARREIEEETGIKDIKFIPGFKEHIKFFFRWPPKNLANSIKKRGQKSQIIFKSITFFLAETKTKKVKISFEHTGYKWLPHEEAISQLTFKNAREILKKADDHLKFKNKVYQAVKEISQGEIMTYKGVAEKAGSPRAWRAVGNILNKNKNPEIPCHRVIKSDGRVGGYNRGQKRKIELLKKEGIKIKRASVFS
ncbi:MAG: hypothetical protein COV69_01840 [Parcubacteria group bacterium CG11_big_fil_rev_8_21_14_0_20_39_14]|nr:MAG: hypothetical protein COV69_01840 [Parcubacteria group bacterium CG11_big_fil_rev_8_21_14_0_20_39_14]PIS34991.1 MAG: hypothetical protein COT36_04770 [Parcubacteria group bacterium CG08_land_8_20_14_0_20_38_56]